VQPRGTVLVIEEYTAARTALSRLLEGSGYRVLTAGNAAEALAICEREHHVDLLVADVNPSHRIRPALVARVRACEPLRGIILTADMTPDHDLAVEHLVRHCDAVFLSKPLNYNALEQQLERMLNLERHAS
jgi:CheY-like chemotaxis protein